MNLWLDDERLPPSDEWTWAKSAGEAIAHLSTGHVVRASLDHDLGYDLNLMPRGTGYQVVCWMEENGVWPPDGVAVHSMNPVGAERMRKVIARAPEEEETTT